MESVRKRAAYLVLTVEQVHRGEFSYQVGRGGGKTIILVVEVEQAQASAAFNS